MNCGGMIIGGIFIDKALLVSINPKLAENVELCRCIVD